MWLTHPCHPFLGFHTCHQWCLWEGREICGKYKKRDKAKGTRPFAHISWEIYADVRTLTLCFLKLSLSFSHPIQRGQNFSPITSIGTSTVHSCTIGERDIEAWSTKTKQYKGAQPPPLLYILLPIVLPYGLSICGKRVSLKPLSLVNHRYLIHLWIEQVWQDLVEPYAPVPEPYMELPW